MRLGKPEQQLVRSTAPELVCWSICFSCSSFVLERCLVKFDETARACCDFRAKASYAMTLTSKVFFTWNTSGYAPNYDIWGVLAGSLNHLKTYGIPLGKRPPEKIVGRLPCFSELDMESFGTVGCYMIPPFCRSMIGALASRRGAGQPADPQPLGLPETYGMPRVQARPRLPKRGRTLVIFHNGHGMSKGCPTYGARLSGARFG